MKIYNLEKQTLDNNFYRKVLYTTPQQQVVLMNIPSGIDIGIEKHKGTTQFIRVEKGSGTAIIGKKKYYLKVNYVL